MLKFIRIIFIGLTLSFLSFDSSDNIHSGVPNEIFVPGNARLNNLMAPETQFADFDKVVNSFMRKWSLSGATVAVSKNGKLVYAKGFGYADKETMIPAEPYHKFRIASVSKLVTAIAIMKLQEDGLLSVNDRVFGPDGILNDSYFSEPKDKRVYSITVGHLLSHKGGWSQRRGDQMFMPLQVSKELGVPLPVSTKEIVRFALNKRLHFTPGAGKSYSNLGYSILGLVIEKVSGMSYEEYCRINILEPIGIYDMMLAKNFYDQKAPLEVTYYEPDDVALKPAIDGSGILVPPAYGGNDIEALGAAGAWLSTAPDMMRLLLSVDGFDSRKDILSNESIKFMTDNYNGYAPVGWKTTIFNGTWWRTGSFPGTTCMIKRQPDGTSWVILSNSSAWNGPELSNSINSMMTRAILQVKAWPENDLFYYSLPVPLEYSFSPMSSK
jgi:CubicO group peptidase (beta-lactamase class C family)